MFCLSRGLGEVKKRKSRRHIKKQANKMIIKPSWTRIGRRARKHQKSMIEEYFTLERPRQMIYKI